MSLRHDCRHGVHNRHRHHNHNHNRYHHITPALAINITNPRVSLPGEDTCPSVDSDTQWKMVEEMGLLSSKPVLHICNVDEDAASDTDHPHPHPHHYVRAIQEFLREHDGEASAPSCLPICIQLEAEAADLDDTTVLPSPSPSPSHPSIITLWCSGAR